MICGYFIVKLGLCVQPQTEVRGHVLRDVRKWGLGPSRKMLYSSAAVKVLVLLVVDTLSLKALGSPSACNNLTEQWHSHLPSFTSDLTNCFKESAVIIVSFDMTDTYLTTLHVLCQLFSAHWNGRVEHWVLGDNRNLIQASAIFLEVWIKPCEKGSRCPVCYSDLIPIQHVTITEENAKRECLPNRSHYFRT